MNIDYEGYEIERLLNYGLKKSLIDKNDYLVIRNYLLDYFKVSEPYYGEIEEEYLETAEGILDNLLSGKYETITEKELISARIMGYLTPRASEIACKFKAEYKKSPVAATEYFYNLSKAVNYIQVAAVNKNIYWKSETKFGELEITINLSKPEKDPKEIAAARNALQSSYPKCLLCAENAGYAGGLNHPARQNHRIVPIDLCKEEWYLQYSPYLYYAEHCILINKEHIPMQISKKTFVKLLGFVEMFPHYFLGSNADLPIVGGSILSHDHFQGGRHKFPMELASPFAYFIHNEFKNVKASIVKWPLSTIRAQSKDKDELIDFSTFILDKWRNYSNSEAGIFAYTVEEGKKTPHNTITPIARINEEGCFEIDLALRNNITTEEHPLGVFHPHADVHHIKKENIGLIEVMGLAILPPRLELEYNEIVEILCGRETGGDGLAKHRDWINCLINAYGTNNSESAAKLIVRTEIGYKFAKVLEDAGIFKWKDSDNLGFLEFMNECGFERI